MLLIIELLFFVAGLWAIILGQVPVGLLKLLFGKGEYDLPPNQARLFGLLLSSPFPVSYIVLLTLTNSLGAKGAGYSIIFEIVYILIIITVSIIIARKARHPETGNIDGSISSASSLEKKTSGYGLRLLIIFGIGFLGFITLVSAITLVGAAITAVTVGSPSAGDFWSDIFPFIFMLGITGIGLFGILKLVQILRK